MSRQAGRQAGDKPVLTLTTPPDSDDDDNLNKWKMVIIMIMMKLTDNPLRVYSLTLTLIPLPSHSSSSLEGGLGAGRQGWHGADLHLAMQHYQPAPLHYTHHACQLPACTHAPLPLASALSLRAPTSHCLHAPACRHWAALPPCLFLLHAYWPSGPWCITLRTHLPALASSSTAHYHFMPAHVPLPLCVLWLRQTGFPTD